MGDPTVPAPVAELLDAAVPRRTVLSGGLATFATLMMSRALGGCSDDPAAPADAATDAVQKSPGADVLDASAPEDVPLAPIDTPPAIDRPPTPDVPTPDVPSNFFPPRDMPPLPRLRSRIADMGPLGAPDANGVRLPPGFRSRVLARTHQRVAGTDYTWHLLPDGGATYGTPDGGWIYTSNCEMPIIGGAGAIRFARDGRITDAYRILDRTNINCAGGKTPWGSWLSCEEAANGKVYECDPHGERPAVARPALGVFKHEAAAVDPTNGNIYLTEDETDGRFYRYVPRRMTPQNHPDLTDGRLQVAAVDTMSNIVRWIDVPDPLFAGTVPTRMQVAESTLFNGGEGIWWHAGVVYFSTKGTNQVFAYDTRTSVLSVLYDARTRMNPPLVGVDNITVTCCGDVLVAEDGGSMQIVAILPSGEIKPVMQIVGHDGSEVCGPAFDPSGTRLYFSSQRGPEGGWTFEVEGPFHAPYDDRDASADCGC